MVREVEGEAKGVGGKENNRGGDGEGGDTGHGLKVRGCDSIVRQERASMFGGE